MTDQPKALEGVRVVAMGSAVTAPLTARYLALHGANVVRVDSHVYLDVLRTQRPFDREMEGNPDGSIWYANINSGAYGIAIDWTKLKGMDIMSRLVRWADVIVENYAPGTLAKWGLDYSSVCKAKPDIIYLSSSLMGQTGPWSGLVGYGQHAAAISGIYNLCGWPEDVPTPIETMYTDFVSPRFGVTAIMAALDFRRRTGRGQYLEQSQVEVGIQLMTPLMMDWTSNAHLAHRTGNRVAGAAPHAVYQCAGDDRWVAIGIFTDEQWEGLGEVEGAPPSLRQDKFKTLLGRKRHEQELDTVIQQWTQEHTTEEIEAGLQAKNVPASVVANSKDTREDVQLNHRGFFRKIRHSVIGEHTYRGPSFRLSKTPDRQSQGPALGEHNYEVCRMLGLSDDEISDAIVEGALGFEPVQD